MKIAVDLRMSGKSGIGAFIDSMLPTLKAGAEVVEIKPDIKPFSLKETLFFPRGLIKKINGCDAYFSPYCNVPGRLFSRGIKVPIFTTIHDVIFLDLPLAGKLGTLARKLIYQRAINMSREIFTVSEFSKGRIQARLRCKKNITVVYSGVPLYNEEAAGDFDSARKTDTIIFVGNIKAHKGIKTLVPAFLKAREILAGQSGSKAQKAPRPSEASLPRLLIVGSKENFCTSDTELDALMREAEKKGIEFTGFVPDEKLKTLIEEARLLVQPSLYEGFGVPPLQALYSGTRAVISDIPVFKEIYGRLPVTFFKAGDADDLARKIAAAYSDQSPFLPVERVYSYHFSAQAVLKRIEESIKMEK
ncbi:MAG: glycosyltransferase family 4 protein [Treponema sp.]|nr:glycosyltransferase family 4 protein [Treponema sp.]